ncbi:MAG: aquaporin, partial [Myxococcaceae bacterium]
QVVGAAVGALLVLMIAHGAPGGYSAAASGLGANGYGAHSPGGYSAASAFLAEALLTGVFVLTILGATDARAPVGFAGIAIGLALTLVHLVAIPITNTSVNPARSLAPALFVGGWAMGQLWLFIIAPMIGAGAAAAVYRTLALPRTRIAATKAERALKSEEAERAARA